MEPADQTAKLQDEIARLKRENEDYRTRNEGRDIVAEVKEEMTPEQRLKLGTEKGKLILDIFAMKQYQDNTHTKIKYLEEKLKYQSQAHPPEIAKLYEELARQRYQSDLIANERARYFGILTIFLEKLRLSIRKLKEEIEELNTELEYLDFQYERLAHA